jgi:hypothetical protein
MENKLPLPPLPPPVRLDEFKVNGINMKNVLSGEEASILVKVALTSDQPEFYLYMKGITNLIADRAFKKGVSLFFNQICSFVLVTHADGTADLYFQNVPIALEILSKHDLNAGQIVTQSNIADIRRVRFPGIDIKPTDGIFVCFKVGWKFGLFFDLAPERSFDLDGMERTLGELYRRLSFEEIYAALADPTAFATLVENGWFPFIEINGTEFEKLTEAYRANFNIEAEEQRLLQKFDAERIDGMGERWWKRPCLAGRQAILEPALAAFKREDSVSCLKIILTEIEGIIQDAHIADVGAGASLKGLLEYVTTQGERKTGNKTSLLFPQEFLKYLLDSTYARFNPKTPEAGVMSRHSVGHGGAAANAYTQVRALQAILTLDQLSFFL